MWLAEVSQRSNFKSQSKLFSEENIRMGRLEQSRGKRFGHQNKQVHLSARMTYYKRSRVVLKYVCMTLPFSNASFSSTSTRLIESEDEVIHSTKISSKCLKRSQEVRTRKARSGHRRKAMPSLSDICPHPPHNTTSVLMEYHSDSSPDDDLAFEADDFFLFSFNPISQGGEPDGLESSVFSDQEVAPTQELHLENSTQMLAQ